MKMTIEVDCTPEEARSFLGLPNVEAINQLVQSHMEEQVRKNMEMMSPEAFMKTWVPGGNPTMDAMQNFMKQAMSSQSGTKSPKDKSGSE